LPKPTTNLLLPLGYLDFERNERLAASSAAAGWAAVGEAEATTARLLHDPRRPPPNRVVRRRAELTPRLMPILHRFASVEVMPRPEPPALARAALAGFADALAVAFCGGETAAGDLDAREQRQLWRRVH
jgi:hypothetical protein